jgi:riboflavin biosynthesis pyrimidine reductase
MTIYANLVIGLDGSTASDGVSSKLSSQEDRRRFHELRKKVDSIFIGGETARKEPYSSTPLPLIVVSKSGSISQISSNEKAVIINGSPIQVLKDAINTYGENVLIEGGPNLLLEVIDLVDELYITIANRTGDGQQVSFDGLTRNFIMEDMEKINGEIFYRFKREK